MRSTAGAARVAAACALAAALLLAAAPASASLPGPARPAAIAAGNAHSCALEDGRAYCWGENDYGQLGDGSTADSAVPVAVVTTGVLAGKTLTQISAGGGGGLDTCALDSAGAVYCWGAGLDGGLGDRSTADSSVPVAVDAAGALAGKTITEISTGADGACALDSAGAAYCWGDNDYGELGDGNTLPSSVPVPVDHGGALAGKTITQVSAGYEDTCALDSAGAAYCWGDDYYGELGDNGRNGNYSDVPLAVSGALAGQVLTQVSAGWWDACALDRDGSAYCWGTGAVTSSAVPVPVSLPGQRLAQVSAGLGENCGLSTAGAAYCWGDNGYGELGDGSTASSAAPVPVSTSGVLAGKTLAQVSAGGFHACATDTTGARYCWGDNNQGDLGDGSTVQSDVPVLSGPLPPAGVTASPASAAAVVAWRAPASLDGGRLLGFTATASPGGASCATAGPRSCRIGGLTAGRAYTVTVVSRTTAGDSGASVPVTVTPGS
jgi:alpha-tubulin suppressor-like RCC1 family protein